MTGELCGRWGGRGALAGVGFHPDLVGLRSGAMASAGEN